MNKNVDTIRYDALCDIRINDLKFEFNDDDNIFIKSYFLNNNDKIVPESSLYDKSEGDDYTIKPLMDELVVELWNLIFDSKYHINSLYEINDVAPKFIQYYEFKYPYNFGSNDSDNIRYMTAFSRSGLFGIQSPSSSRSARLSMVKVLESHYNSNIFGREYYFKFLKDAIEKVSMIPNIMDMGYHTLLISSRQSSSSIKGDKRKYRDYLFENTLDDIINESWKSDFSYSAGTRLDRRGKYRLVCSYNAAVRALDHMINAGQYNLFNPKDGIYRNYVTEGLSTKIMWKKMKQMTSNKDFHVICTDYSGYDTQFGPNDYLNISYLLNKHRMNDSKFIDIWEPYRRFMLQPKILLKNTAEGDEVILPFYLTLASGLKGTHSIENLMGIMVHRDMHRKGINIHRLLVNGDDQNALVSKHDVKNYHKYMEENGWNISVPKSLSGHEMSVWSKKWYSERMYPVNELSNIRSLTETEGAGLLDVEESKISSNYGTILKVCMNLLRLDIPMDKIINYINKLCNLDGININMNRIPVSLNEVKPMDEYDFENVNVPNGLLSQRRKLESIGMPYKILGASNYYNLLLGMWKNRKTIKTSPEVIEYYPRDTMLKFDAMYDYSLHDDVNIPYNLKNVIQNENESKETYTSRQFINSTSSYDGIITKTYYYYDLISLAVALNNRNETAWREIS